MTVEELQQELVGLDSREREKILYFLVNLKDTNVSEEEHTRLWDEECQRRLERYERGESVLTATADVVTHAYAVAREHRAPSEEKQSA